MRRKKESEGEGHHDRWLVSYADFITLLFAFFVVMFATTQTDKGKAGQVSESVKKALAGPTFAAAVTAMLGGKVDDAKSPGVSNENAKEAPLAELHPSLDILTKELHDEIEKGTMSVSMQPRGLVISFRQAALFPSGGDDIAPGAFASVAKVASAIGKIPNPVRLEGHTDSIPIHNSRFRSNWELSAARSIALMMMLTDEFGVSRERMSIAGYADTAAVDSNDTNEGRAHNRRVDIILLNETGAKGEPARTTPEHP